MSDLELGKSEKKCSHCGTLHFTELATCYLCKGRLETVTKRRGAPKLVEKNRKPAGLGLPIGPIEKLAIEIEEIALGVYSRDTLLTTLELVSKAKKIQQLASRRGDQRIVGQVAALVCQGCDLRMVEDSLTGKYQVFRCTGCGIKVGTLKP